MWHDVDYMVAMAHRVDGYEYCDWDSPSVLTVSEAREICGEAATVVAQQRICSLERPPQYGLSRGELPDPPSVPRKPLVDRGGYQRHLQRAEANVMQPKRPTARKPRQLAQERDLVQRKAQLAQERREAALAWVERVERYAQEQERMRRRKWQDYERAELQRQERITQWREHGRVSHEWNEAGPVPRLRPFEVRAWVAAGLPITREMATDPDATPEMWKD
jgi:hypothetical protein